MNLLGAVLYDPAVAVSKATSSLLAMTVFDTTNLRLTVTVPAHGMVRFRLIGTVTGATTMPVIYLGVMVGSTIVARCSPTDFPGTANAATQTVPAMVDFVATGLTPGSTNFDAAYGVEVVVAATNIKYGGPNDTTTNNAWGAFQFEAWDPRPMTLALDGGVNVKTWNGTSVSASYLMPSVVRQWDQTSVSSSNVAVADFSTRLNANVQQWAGTSVSSNNIVLRSEISLSSVNVTAWAGTSVSSNNIVLRSEISLSSVNVTAWAGVSVSTANVALWQTISSANVTQWSGASTSSNDVALFDSSAVFNALVGLPVNATRWAGASTSTNNIVLYDNSQLYNTLVGLPVDVHWWVAASVSASNIAVRNTLAKTTHITGFNDLSQATLSSVVFGSAMTEDYAVDGAAFTLPQALYQVWSRLSEFSISDKTITALKLDGTTQAMTFSLDSATAPTKVERVT